jgi:PqqD family protein of HPr-rel-A system
MNPDSLWHAVEPRAISWRQWDDELVVYNDSTGSTHHLSSLGGALMLALLRHTSGIEMTALVRDIAERVDTAEDAALLSAEIDSALTELAELRLAVCSRA